MKSEDENSGVEISSLFSIEAGLNYYVHRFMHFFFAVRYVGGASFSGAESPYSLNEIRISAGLGFNFLAKRKKS